MGARTKKPLNKRQANFVAAYLKTGASASAARSIGVDHRPEKAGHRLLQQKAVKDAIEHARKEMVNQGVYSLTQAMQEAQATIEFARETGNANAMAKAIELRAKLNGLLVEKHQHQVANFSLNIGGIDDEEKPPIDVTTVSSQASDDDEDLLS